MYHLLVFYGQKYSPSVLGATLTLHSFDSICFDCFSVNKFNTKIPFLYNKH